jgi:hypothetical protein
MPVTSSQKIMLISDNSRISMPIKTSITPFGLEIDEEFLNLHSLSLMRKAINSTKSTNFIRSELLRFIKQNGYPFLTIIDYKIDTGLGADIDPDKMKILRTILISYIILSKGNGFENLKANIILLGTNSQQQEILKIETNPHLILGLLATKDESINAFITELKKDMAKFSKLFYIKGLNTEIRSDEIVLKLTAYIQTIKARENLTKPSTPESDAPKHDAEDHDTPRLIFRIDDNNVFSDGEIISDEKSEFNNLNKNEFYVLGHWTNKTQLDLTKKIIKVVNSGVTRERKFDAEEKIIINLNGNCSVDAATTASIAQLLVRDLSGYKNIIFKVSQKNMEILQNSAGAQMIKKYLQPENQ